MSRTKYHTRFIFHFTVDMFVLLLIAVLINIHNTAGGVSHILSIILVLAILLAASHFIVLKWKLSYVYFLVPVSIVLLMLFGSYWLTALLVTGFAVWTLEQLHENINNHFNEKLLAGMFVLILLLNLFNTSSMEEYKLLIHIIAIGMFVFYFVGRAIILMAGSGYKISGLFKIIMLMSILLFGISAMITGAYKYVVYAVQMAVIFLLNGILLLLTPFFKFLENIELDYPVLEQEEMETAEEGEMTEEIISGSGAISTVSVITILLLLAALGLIIFIIMYFKKRGGLKKQTDESSTYKTFVADGRVKNTKREKRQPPNSKVRKLYYSFELWMAGRGLGRYHDETIDEWLDRLKLKQNIDDKVVGKYKRYRYDSTELTDDEFKAFKRMLDEFKRNLTDKNK